MKILHCLFLFFLTANASALPSGFVYLRDVDPTILQDIRYAGFHNFVGRPIAGYETNQCILTKQAALALAKVQAELKKKSLTLKVYDCYRPMQGGEDFVAWSKEIAHQEMKAEFYPNVNKADFFKLGYVAEKSGHSRGSTVDLTLVPLPAPQEPAYHPGQKLVACTADYEKRYKDNSIDMGTGYDCLDKLSHINISTTKIRYLVFEHRVTLKTIMMKYGFEPYEKEWWHFSLKDEPYPDTYFNFPVK